MIYDDYKLEYQKIYDFLAISLDSFSYYMRDIRLVKVLIFHHIKNIKWKFIEFYEVLISENFK